MNCKMQSQFKTVLGNIQEKDIGKVLPHEHICCYSEYLYKMAGKQYLDKELLVDVSVNCLKSLKEKYDLSTLVDCTPINIGRDIELLKKVSEKSGVNIICSTGFYYTEEPVIYNTEEERLSEYIVSDAISTNAGVIKCAVENEEISPYIEKVLRACAKAQKRLNLPIVMHSNANNKSAVKALEIILSEGVKPQSVTVSHLSDTEDIEYIKFFAKCGCYIGLDRLYEIYTEEYINSKIGTILELCGSGYEDRILLSHDDSFFNGLSQNPKIKKTPRFNYCFESSGICSKFSLSR